MQWLALTPCTPFWLGFLVLVRYCLLSPAIAANQNAPPPEPLCGDGASSNSGQLTYSVVRVSNRHVTTLFDNPARLCAFTEGLVYMQMVESNVDEKFNDTAGWAPFFAKHPADVDRRVTVIDLQNNDRKIELSLTEEQVIDVQL